MTAYEGLGASGKPDRATAVEPVPVSPLRDGIPSAAWFIAGMVCICASSGVFGLSFEFIDATRSWPIWAVFACIPIFVASVLFVLACGFACFAQGIEARSDETPQAVQPGGQEPGPKDAPKASGETPNQQAGRG